MRNPTIDQVRTRRQDGIGALPGLELKSQVRPDRSLDAPHVEATRDVHLWSTWIDGEQELDQELAELDRAERARAARFAFEVDRRRYVRSHAFLRRVLTRYLTPTKVVIRRDGLGKPQLHPPGDMAFSLAHAGNLAVVAVTRGGQVGVDVEPVRPVTDAVEIAYAMFTKREADLVRFASIEDRSGMFLELWTRKESIVKALGVGLLAPLDAFEVIPETGGLVLQLHGGLAGGPIATARFDAPPGYVGAVSLTRAPVTVRQMDAGEASWS